MYGKAPRIGLALLIVFPVLFLSLGCAGGVSQEEYSKVESDLAEVQSTVTSLEKEKASLEAQLSEARGRVATLQQEKASLESQIATLQAQETKVSQLEEANSTLKEQVSSLQEQVGALATEAEKVSRLQDQIDSLESQAETLKAAKAILETEAEKVPSLEERIEGLEAAKAILEAQLSALREEKASLEDRIEELEIFALKASPSVAVTFTGSGHIGTEPFIVDSSPWMLEWQTLSGYWCDFAVTLRDARTGETLERLVDDRVLNQTGSTWVAGHVGTLYFEVTGPVQPWGWTLRVVVQGS